MFLKIKFQLTHFSFAIFSYCITKYSIKGKKRKEKMARPDEEEEGFFVVEAITHILPTLEYVKISNDKKKMDFRERVACLFSSCGYINFE